MQSNISRIVIEGAKVVHQLFRIPAVALLVSLAISTGAPAADVIYFDTPDSADLFAKAEEKSDFWPIVREFVSEHHLSYCGVASSVIVLNALEVEPPLSPDIYPYSAFNQVNFFTASVVGIKPPQKVLADGLILSEVAEMLRSHGVKVELHFADTVTVDEFRDLARKALADPSQMVIVNYLRAALDQPGPGHISPLAAYHEGSDRFLMMDVARYKLPPSWVQADDFLAAMKTIDSSSGKARGFLIVQKP